MSETVRNDTAATLVDACESHGVSSVGRADKLKRHNPTCKGAPGHGHEREGSVPCESSYSSPVMTRSPSVAITGHSTPSTSPFRSAGPPSYQLTSPLIPVTSMPTTPMHTFTPLPLPPTPYMMPRGIPINTPSSSAESTPLTTPEDSWQNPSPIIVWEDLRMQHGDGVGAAALTQHMAGLNINKDVPDGHLHRGRMSFDGRPSAYQHQYHHQHQSSLSPGMNAPGMPAGTSSPQTSLLSELWDDNLYEVGPGQSVGVPFLTSFP